MDAKGLRDGDFFEVTGSVFKNIKESWQAVQLNLLTFVILMIIPGALAILLLPILLLPAITGTDAGTATAVILGALGLLAILVIVLIIAPAITLTQLASVTGKKLEFGEAFNMGKKYVVRFVVLGILCALTILVGLVLFIIPGLLAIFFLSLSPYILIDKDVSATDAMKQSYEMTKEYWKPVLAVMIVNVVISIPGSIIPIIGSVVGLILTVMYFCLSPYIYSVIVGKKVAKVA